MQKGKFIVFEGPDGSGKSTLATRIGDWLNNDIKKPTAIARSPGGTQYANAIRSLVFSGLTEAERYMLWMKYEGNPIGKTSMRDLAAAMGLHYQTIVYRMDRIRKKLRVAMEEVR